MANNLGLVQRGLLLLGLMLVTAVIVVFIILRRGENPTEEVTPHPALAALAVGNPIGSFPDSVNWGALAALSQNLPSSPGWKVRYNAAQSLALRGSPKVPLDVLCQMLDEDQQMRNFRVSAGEGKEIVDKYGALATVLDALKALQQWHKNKKAVEAVGVSNPELQRVYAAVDKLTKSSNETVRKEADSVKQKVTSGKW